MGERVVVVGGGVIGLGAAWALAKRGWAVTVLDAAAPGSGASSGNAGWIVPALSGPVPAPGLVRTSLAWMARPGSPLYIKPRLDGELARWLLAFWRHCTARDYRAGLDATMTLNARTMALYDELQADGVACERHAAGLLCAYRDRRACEHDLRALEPLTAHGYDLPPLLDGGAVRDLEPALAPAVTSGYFLPGERHLRPDGLIAGLVSHLTGRGVAIRPGTPATGFEIAIQGQPGGRRVTAVATPDGRIAADAVVIAAGAWTPGVARLAGVRVPIQAGKGYHLDYAPAPVAVGRAVYLHEARVAVTPLAGLLRLSGTMEFSGLNREIPPARVAAIARAGQRYFRDWPAVPGGAATWSGMRPMTPDGLPVIGRAPGFGNLALASGHAMLGVTLAPASGEALADLLTTGRVPDVLQPFDPGRFA